MTVIPAFFSFLCPAVDLRYYSCVRSLCFLLVSRRKEGKLCEKSGRVKIKLFGTVTSLPSRKDVCVGGGDQARGVTEEWIGPSIMSTRD